MDLGPPIYTTVLSSLVVLDTNLELPTNLLGRWVQYGLVVYHFV